MHQKRPVTNTLKHLELLQKRLFRCILRRISVAHDLGDFLRLFVLGHARVVHYTNAVADVVGLFHEEEEKQRAGTAEDGDDVKRPAVVEAVVDEAADDGRKVVGSGEQEAVPAEVFAALVGKVDVCNRGLWERLDGRGEETGYNVAGDPLAVASGVGAPYCDSLKQVSE